MHPINPPYLIPAVEIVPAPGTDPAAVEKTRALAETKTRLTKTSEQMQDQLINWGYAVCDAGMRRWVCPDAASKPKFPYPGSGVG